MRGNNGWDGSYNGSSADLVLTSTACGMKDGRVEGTIELLNSNNNLNRYHCMKRG